MVHLYARRFGFISQSHIRPYFQWLSAFLHIIEFKNRGVYLFACFVVGMTKVKFSKSEENNAVFLERRRAALERSVAVCFTVSPHFVSMGTF